MAAGNSSNSLSQPTVLSVRQVVDVPWERVESFTSQVIHDVRNGLNAIELQLTFLGEISVDPEAVEEVKRLRSTLLEVTRQLQTVKTACSPVVPSIMEYPAADFFEDLQERLFRQEPERAGTVTWNVISAPTDVLLVDPNLSINGLLELFKNAFHFGSTSIRCATASDTRNISFILHENPLAAPTIPPERWGHEPLLSSRRGAFGLGLFRVRQILETQGGSLRFGYSAAGNVLTTTASFPRPAQAD